MEAADLQDITWDDFIQIAKRCQKEKTGHAMMSLDPSDLGLARIIMQSAGEWYTGEDGTTVTIKDNESFKAGLNVLATLLNEGLVEQVSDWDGGVNAVNPEMLLQHQQALGILVRFKGLKIKAANGRLHRFRH